SRPLQLDGGTGTGGRMSAPATRVFLLPAALYLTRVSDRSGQLRATLSKAWQNYNLDLATTSPAEHPFVQLAAALYDASVDGACRLLVEMPGTWTAIVAWIEQLMEESLGKGGKGVVVFTEMAHGSQAACFNTSGTLHVRATADAEPQEHIFALHQPYLFNEDLLERLAATTTSFLGWQLSMALYGYLQHITFAGQPAVENYKARARKLRTMDDPLQVTQNWPASVTGDDLTLLAPTNVERGESPASTFASALLQAASSQDERTRLAYLDLTLNGEAPVSLRKIIATHLYTIGNTLLKVPVKPRHAPADYHSTEQSEMDGPPYLVSLRLLMREHEESIIGTYTDTFLRAQAVSTWQAMIEQGRSCFLLLIGGSVEQASEALERFFADVEQYVGVGG
ncbi:MAG: hypothetical protein JOZ18_19320, partial [Chloroflexi bacterium]|nr:hypothetical protein [Chloroflexota bacterium]